MCNVASQALGLALRHTRLSCADLVIDLHELIYATKHYLAEQMRFYAG